MIEKIIKRLKSLPPLPESIQKVREICNNPEGTIKDLVPIIKNDPMFTADILKAANSPLYGFSGKITSIDQAVSLFGMETIQGFAISYAMRKNFSINLSVYGIGPNHLTDISIMQNALVSKWGKLQASSHQEEIMTLSIIMELGKILIAKIITEDNRDESFKRAISRAETFEHIVEIEDRFLSTSSEAINALMFKHWKFNETMVEIMQYIEKPEKANDSIKRATYILRVVKEAMPITSPLSKKTIQLALQKAKEYNLNDLTLKNTISTMQSSASLDDSSEEEAFFITY